MSSADQYRIKAAQLAEQAREEVRAQIRMQLLSLAQSYLRLAEQADRNSQLSICYDTPLTTMGNGPRA